MWMSANARAVLCGQHDADSGCKSTHCHVAILDPQVTDEAMRKQKVKHEIAGAFSSTTSKVQSGEHKGKPLEFEKLAPYVLKGDPTNLMMASQGITQEMIDRWIAAWIDPEATKIRLDGDKFVKVGKKEHTADSKYAIIQEIVARIAQIDILTNRQLVDVVRDVIIKHEQVVGMYKIIDLCDAALMYSDKHKNTWKNAAVQFLDKRYA